MEDRMRVLYVDDEPDLLVIGQLFLERTNEFRVDTSTSALEALNTHTIQAYDAIISDYQMPGMDGLDFLKEVRERFGNIPFILFTGRGREEIVIHAINNGADFYVQKGGDPQSQFAELAHKIKRAVTRKRQELSLVESEKRLADIINFLPDATFAIDRTGHVIAWNLAIEDMTGVPASEMLGRGEYQYAFPFYQSRRRMLIDLIFEPDDVIDKHYAHIIRKKDVLIADTSLPRPKELPVTLMGQASPLYDREGTVVGAIESIRDITALKKAEIERRAAYEQITANEEELREQLDELTSNQAALKLSEEKFRDIVETSPDLVWEMDAEGVFTYISPLCTNLLGYTPEEMIGTPVFSLIPDEVKPLLRRFLTHGADMSALPKSINVAARTRDGRAITMEIRPVVRWDGKGCFTGLRGIARDITEKWRVEKALNESERRFRELADLLPQGIYEADANGRMTFVNQCALEMFGYTGEDIESGLNVINMIAPEDRTRASVAIRRMIEQGIHPGGGAEYLAIRKDGSTFPASIFSSPISRDGGIDGIRGILMDISERKMTEEDLRAANEQLASSGEELRRQCQLLAVGEQQIRESEELLRKMILASPDIIVRSDLEGRIVFINGKGAQMGGVKDPTEFIGKSIFSFFAPESLPAAIENTKLMFEGPLGPKEYTFIAYDGQRVPLEVNGDVLFTPEGIPYGMVYICRDISERREAEGALRQANRQLNLLSSITGHDNLNKVTAILGYLDLIRTKFPDPELVEYIGKLESATEAIRSQIEFTKVYQDLGTHEPLWQDLNTVLLRLQVPDSIRLNADEHGVKIYADVMLEKVFFNLLDNSIRHGERVTEIRVSSGQSSEGLIIAWEDNGIGIPDEEKERIFERGFGVNTGLGMFLVREVLSLTDITIREAGVPGRGARFEISVPREYFRVAHSNRSSGTGNPYITTVSDCGDGNGSDRQGRAKD